MKKYFTLLVCLLCAAAAMSAAEKPHNKAFYLVGNLNGWQAPYDEYAAETNPYKLLDEDGDGIYTGTFDISEFYLNFEVFSEIGNWDDQENIYGSQEGVFLFKDQPKSLVLHNAFPNSYGKYFEIYNWQSGTIEMSIEWKPATEVDPTETTAEWLPVITLTSSTQPYAPLVPNIYVVGDFNNWQLPSEDNLNGAIELTEEYSGTWSFDKSAKAVFPAGDVKMAFCRIYPAGSPEILQTQYDFPITLYSYINPEGEYVATAFSQSLSLTSGKDPKDYAFTVKDWKGGTMALNYSLSYWDNSYYMALGAYDTPVAQLPEKIYAISEENGEKHITELIINNNSYWAGFSVGGKDSSIIFSTENSLNPDPANCWGVSGSLEDSGLTELNNEVLLPLVKGGKPFSFEFPVDGILRVSSNWALSYSYVNVQYIDNIIRADKIYICGNVVAPDGTVNDFQGPSESNREFYDEHFRLTETSDGIFEGTYWVPVKERSEYSYFPEYLSQMRFFSDLLGWKPDASLGSYPEDFYCVPADLSNGPVTLPIVKKGLGNWGPCFGEEWVANWVHFKVDINNAEVTLSITDSGVDTPTAEPGKERWFNLQGIEVAAPSNGIYIHCVDGKSRLERVNR